MKNIFHIAFSYLKYYKKQTAALFTGVMLFAALLSGMGGLLFSGRNAACDNARTEYGDWHYSIRADKGQWFDKYRKLPEGGGFTVEKTGMEIVRKAISEPFGIQFVYADDGYLDMMGRTVLKGRYPGKENEIAMDMQTLKNLGVSENIGTKITLDGQTFVLSGIVSEMPEKLPELLKNADDRQVFVNSTLDYGTNGEFFYLKFKEDKMPYKQLAAFMEKYGITSGVSRNNGLVGYIGLEKPGRAFDIIKTGLSYKEAGLPYIWGQLNETGKLTETAILTALVFFGAFIICSLFKISVIRRMSEYSIMQTIGMTDGGNTAILLAELFTICLFGYPFGCLFGNLVSWLLYAQWGRIFIVQRGMYHSGGKVMAEEYAALRLPDAGTYHMNVHAMVFGFLFFSAFIVFVSIHLQAKMRRLTIRQMLAKEVKARPCRKIYSRKKRSLTGLLTHRFMFEKKSTFFGILLSLSIGSVIFLGTFYVTENTKINNELTFKADDGLGSDIQIYTQSDVPADVIPEKDVLRMKETAGIRQFHPVRYLLGEIPLNDGKLVWKPFFADVADDPSNPPDPNLKEKYNGVAVQTGENDYKLKVNIYGYDDEMLEELNEYLLEGEIRPQQMRKENSVVVKTIMDGQGNYDGIDIHPMDMLELKTISSPDMPKEALKFQGKDEWYQSKNLKVAALASRPLAKVDTFIGDEGTTEVDIIMTNEQMKENFGVEDYRTISISLDESQGGEEAAKTLQASASEIKKCVMKDYRMQIKAQNLYLMQKMLFYYGIAAILLAVSLIHIMNSMQYLVAARRHEFGILRAMGVTDSGFLKMMAKEGLRYGIYSGMTVAVMYFAVQKILYYFMVHVYLYLHPQGFISPWILPVLVLVNILLCTAVTLFSAAGILRRQIIEEIRK